MKHFINGFQKGFLGTWHFIGEYGSLLMLLISVIEYWRGLYLASVTSILTAILFAVWDIQKEIRDKK